VFHVFQTYFVDGVIERYVEPALKMLVFGEDLKHKQIAQKLHENANWPPTSQDDLAQVMDTHINIAMVM
jgi:hypothetical protein